MNCRGLSPDPWEAMPQPRAGLVDLTKATPKTCFPSFKVWDQVCSETEEVPIQCFPPVASKGQKTRLRGQQASGVGEVGGCFCSLSQRSLKVPKRTSQSHHCLKLH